MSLVAYQPQLQFDEPEQHYRLLHEKPYGTVLLWQPSHPKKRWQKLRGNGDAIAEFLNALEKDRDTYLSVNQFDGWRTIDLLRSLRANFVDIDLKDGQRPEIALALALQELAHKRLPAPSFAVYSGRGLHLYWLLHPVPAQALPVWQRIEDKLVEALTEIGADPRARDCTRVLRLVGTRNNKNGAWVYAETITGYRWPLYELANEVLGPRRKPRAKGQVRDLEAARARQGKSAAHAIRGSIYERWHKVYQDLLTIGRHYGTIPEGHRDTWLFLSAVALSWFARAEALEHEIELLAKSYTTLKGSEVKKVIKTIVARAEKAARGEKVEWNGQLVDPRYRFRRATLYRWIQPLIPNELLPNLHAIVPDNVATERKEKRDSARWGDRNTGKGYRQGTAEKAVRAREMRAQGMSYRKIAKYLGAPMTSVVRWCKEGCTDSAPCIPSRRDVPCNVRGRR